MMKRFRGLLAAMAVSAACCVRADDGPAAPAAEQKNAPAQHHTSIYVRLNRANHCLFAGRKTARHCQRRSDLDHAGRWHG